MRTILTSVFLFISILVFTQERYFSDPVRIPMHLSGSFAELRSNHFHSGIDIKTQGTTGIPVFSVADGYISRIVVSPTGFGKALYINHPNGTTSVYAHLLKFTTAVEKYIRDKQYENRSFRIDMQIPQYLFKVKQNEEIAKSGNSGSSGGPHLRFEIRDTKTEEPLNPLKYNFPVSDRIAPKIFTVLIVPLSEDSHVNYSQVQQSYPVVFYDGKYHLKNNPLIPVWGKIGIAIQSNDYFDGSYNKCGINLLRMAIDDETYFTFQLNRFAFGDSRYINSHIVYPEYINSTLRFIKTWLEPGNRLPIYNHNGSLGIISPEQDKTQKAEIELQDTYGNTSMLVFSLTGNFKSFTTNGSEPKENFRYDKENSFISDDAELIIPRGALYNNFEFSYKKEPAADAFYSDYHFIHDNTVPLHSNAALRIKIHSIPEELTSKAVLVNIDENGEYNSAGGTYKKGWIETRTRNLGTYAVLVDTIAPTISALSITDNALTETGRIRFEITDELSGIKNIEGWLDGKWALFEYDPKNKRITHYFDKDRFEFKKQHTLKLEVIDYRNNSSVYEAGFWK